MEIKKSIKGAIFFTILIFMFGINELPSYAEQEEVGMEKETAIFLVPHQDDELLTFGIAIQDRIWNNYDVHLVLMTDGGASKARQSVGNTLGYEISKEDFVEARNKELIRSAQILGIDSEHIHFMNFPDGEIAYKDIKKTIVKFVNEYPNAQFNSLTYMDKNSSHSRIGKGLQQMYEKGVVKEARFYMTFYQFGPDYTAEFSHDEFLPHYKPVLEASANVYERWQPEYGWYAVGGHSVPKLIEEIKSITVIKYHEPGYLR